MRQIADRKRFFGGFVVDSYIEASPRRYDAEPTDLQRPPLQPRPGHASAKKPLGKVFRGGRDPQTSKCQVHLRTTVRLPGMFTYKVSLRRRGDARLMIFMYDLGEGAKNKSHSVGSVRLARRFRFIVAGGIDEGHSRIACACENTVTDG